MLERVRLMPVIICRVLVLEHERDFHDSRCSSSHQRIAEDSMNLGTDFQMLVMGRHGVAGKENHKSWYQVPLGPPASRLA